MKIIFTVLFSLAVFAVTAQDSIRGINASFLRDQNITIDGSLNDQAWKIVDVANDFVEYEPDNGGKPTYDTKVKFLYDDQALYVGVEMIDYNPDSIIIELSQRDQVTNSDWFFFVISPYNDGQNGFKFLVTSAGVQFDSKIIGQQDDTNWDAVWYSEIGFTDSSWVIEYKIPWSAIRFSELENYSWDINMMRENRRFREMSSWSFIDKKKDGELTQSGRLNGIRNIKPPLRLAFYPYASGYAEKFAENDNLSYSLNYGMDLKLGINESYTLDMTLIPDFGQVQSDDRIYNFTPFEVQYDEKRQFFTEGTEIFNKAGIFYSRRVGKQPVRYWDVYNELDEGESIDENPDKTSLINATKISGRGKNGLALGLFNAMTSPSSAIIVDSLGNKRDYITQEFTNYNMIVVDQNLANSSNIHFANTNVMHGDHLANVSASKLYLKNKKQSYAITLEGALSQIYDKGEDGDLGHRYEIELSKISGNFKAEVGYSVESDTYNPNDMGFLRRNNRSNYELDLSYNIYEPFKRYLNWYNDFHIEYNRLYQPNKFEDFQMRVHSRTTLKKSYLSVGGFMEWLPVERHDYYESRDFTRVFIMPGYYAGNFWLSPDYRKRLAVDVNGGGFRSNDNTMYGFWGGVRPRLRINKKWNLFYSLDMGIDYNQQGYVRTISGTPQSTIVFGTRDVMNVQNSFTTSYIFSNKAYISMRLRHYWVTTEYAKYHTLNDEGYLDDYQYSDNADFTVNIFNIDLVYTWNFAPGSQLSIVWKNALDRYDDDEVITNFFSNVRNLSESPATNSLSVKFLYYLDYNSIFKGRR